ncbi:MAG TPA: hypothetical protein VIL00_03710 [Pseudonocardiaceae bacterium]
MTPPVPPGHSDRPLPESAREAFTALSEWQTDSNSEAYFCPRGHGLLSVVVDPDVPEGVDLRCARCGHRFPVDADLVSRAFAAQEERRLGVNSPAGTPELPNRKQPRGLQPDGTIRTTGWLSVRGRLVGAPPIAALTAFLLSFPLLNPQDGDSFPLGIGLLGYLVGLLYVRSIRPSSRVRPLPPIPASQLCPGQFVRLYGTIGPVGEVVAVAGRADGSVLVRVAGGNEYLWAPDERAYPVVLLD